MSIAWVPTTPGNWVFHCHFASHVGETVTLHGSPDAHTVQLAGQPSGPKPTAHGGHEMRGLVIGMHVTPAPRLQGARRRRAPHDPAARAEEAERLVGRQTAYGFVMQTGDSVPARDSVRIPAPLLELRRGEPVRTAREEHDGRAHRRALARARDRELSRRRRRTSAAWAQRIMPPIAPGDSFAAEFTPPRSGTFPYHSHLNELRQIGSGMYGAIIVTDAPRDTTRDHVIVAGGGGVPVFHKAGPAFLLVNGRTSPRPIEMTVGDTNRLRIVEHPQRRDAASSAWPAIPPSLAGRRWRATAPIFLQRCDARSSARIGMGPGQTADFLYVPDRPGRTAARGVDRRAVDRDAGGGTDRGQDARSARCAGARTASGRPEAVRVPTRASRTRAITPSAASA